jgi:hypothetical protein
MQDLFKMSICLEEDSPAPAEGAPPSEGHPAAKLETPPGIGDPAPTLKAKSGTPPKAIGYAREPDADWWKPISEYLKLGTILYDETET